MAVAAAGLAGAVTRLAGVILGSRAVTGVGVALVAPAAFLLAFMLALVLFAGVLHSIETVWRLFTWRARPR